MLALGPMLALVVGLRGSPDEAADPVVRWQAPEGCPDQVAMKATVERYVGRSLGDETVRAEGRVQRDEEGRFRLALGLAGAEGQEQRTLDDADCAVLSDVAALMIAVAIDPEAAAKAMEDRADGPSSPEPVPAQPVVEAEPEEVEDPPEPALRDERTDAAPMPSPTETEPRAPRSCRPGPSRVRTRGLGRRPRCVALGAGPSMQWGTLPRVGAGLRGEASLLWPRLRLSAGGSFFFARPARVDPASTLGGDVRLGTGHARGCGRLGWGTLEVPLCAGVELGALRGQGVGIDVPRDDRVLWAAVLVDAGLGWSPVRRFALRAQVGAAAPLVRQRFEIGGLGLVHAPSVVGLRMALQGELRI